MTKKKHSSKSNEAQYSFTILFPPGPSSFPPGDLGPLFGTGGVRRLIAPAHAIF